jgi:hypothetical protein
LNDNTLSRIPFTIRDELMIASMARWMRFIGAVKVVGGLATVFVLLVGIIFGGGALTAGPPTNTGADAPSITVSVNGTERKVPLEKVRRIVADNQITFYALGAFGLILGVAGTMLGFVLHQAADSFEHVARTDVADQDYVTAGITQLNTYFKISILLGVAAVLVAITAGLGLVAKISAGS